LGVKKSEKHVSGRRNKDARAAGVSPYTMINGISLGAYVIAGKNYKKSRLRELPSVKVGRSLRFDVVALNAYVEQHTIETK
jgi:hypothetical protein